MAEKSSGPFVHAKNSIPNRELVDFEDWRRAVARLRLFFEGVSSRVARRRTALWRDASLYSHLRFVVRCACDRDSCRTPCTHDGQIEIRTVADNQGRIRSDDD